ncbi:MAG: prepilin-type N-terminal cleavage/methylation domain-containing protein [Vampirovibrionales bacterium]|nr:prepilin-type N-terminal cleavage/methylation domain-containing protein [Vampirovibrionales bacterium]
MKLKGFTLAELLIALAILGVIATFTIPKVLTAQANSKNNAIAKEAATLSGAFEAYKMDNPIDPATFYSADLTPYINYVKFYTGTIDDDSGVSETCAPGNNWYTHCLVLHNGAILILNDQHDAAEETPDGIWSALDIDGSYNGEPSLWFVIYMNGRLSTNEVHTNGATPDPPWFSWN